MQGPTTRSRRTGFLARLARLASTLVAAAAIFLSPLAHAAISPEFQALLNDISADFKVTAVDMKECDGAALAMARQAMNRRFLSNAMVGPVVIGAFENVCKPFLDLFGLGMVGTSYSVAKCAFQYLDSTTDARGFAACLVAEGVAFSIGKVFEALGVDPSAAAGANVPIGKGLDGLKGMVNDYHSGGSASEFDSVEYGPSEGFPCQVTLSMKWSKPPNPVQGDGEIMILVSFSGCDCSRSGTQYSAAIANGYVSYRVPVKFVRGSGGAPAWYADGPHGTLSVHAQCCGRSQTTVRIYSSTGTLIRTDTNRPMTDRPTGGPPPPPPPPPPSPPPPPPPTPTWPQTPQEQLAMCPECASIARDMDLTRQGIAQVEARIGGLLKSLGDNRASQGPINRRIAALQAELNAQAGTGGSGFDPDTGNTTTAITQADGTVRVTVKGPNGEVIESHTRPRRDLARAREDLGKAQAELDALKAAEGAINGQLARARASRDGLVADLDRLSRELADCLERCRRRVLLVSVEVVRNVTGNNPFDPQNPGGGGGVTTGPTGPTTCITPQPSAQTQTLACPGGQTGSIVRTRTYSCTGTTWSPGPYVTTSNTCSSAPTTCTGQQPSPETQTLSCPAGQTGSIVQTRTYSCVGTTWTPGAYVTTSNTCTAPVTGCATNFSTGNYSCSGACGINSTTLNVTPGNNTMTANPFGANSNVPFSCSGASATASNLVILGAPNHTCTLSGLGATSFGVLCRNTSGGTCNTSCSR